LRRKYISREALLAAAWELNKCRLKAAELFVEAAKKQNVEIDFKIIQCLGHWLSEVQVSGWREFFKINFERRRR